jgi:GTPase SAR1 family protein
VDLPFESPEAERAKAVVRDIIEQLDQHLIPRVTEGSVPAVVVVAGSTGSGKSTIVNALLGDDLTAAGVLRPTTKVPHLFHHPSDGVLLSSAARRATSRASDAVPRGLALVDSPDIDSLVGENREIARELLDAADLWIFVTTAARYGDAVPWEVLRAGAARGASIAIVLSRVTADIAAHVRRDLVERLKAEGLESLPLFVIPEEPEGLAALPGDVIQGLRRWLDTVAAKSATTIVERTMLGATQALKEWLEQLAEFMDDQAAAVKVARGEVRRAAARAEQEGGEFWFREIAVGPIASLWARGADPGGPLFRIRSKSWNKRKSETASRELALAEIRGELVRAVEGTLSFSAAQASQRMIEGLTLDATGVGAWMLDQRDPTEAAGSRARHAREAALGWMERCAEISGALPGAAGVTQFVGADGLATVFASASLGVPQARQSLALLVGSGLQEHFDQARAHLTAARRYCINREALDMIAPGDLPSLAPDASAVIRLRRAELRGLL